jgi:hypothetical protein
VRLLVHGIKIIAIIITVIILGNIDHSGLDSMTLRAASATYARAFDQTVMLDYFHAWKQWRDNPMEYGLD